MTDPVPPRRLVLALSLLAAVLGASPPPAAGDWPMQGRDIARSGVTRQRLDLPLVEVWSYAPVRPPAPSWPPPARQDFWHEIAELRPAVTHDRFFAPVVCGGLVYFASSGDDQVRALDLETGEARWTFFCEAPVRLAPSAGGGKLLFGSDDGWVYCVEGERGTLVWRFRPFEDDRRIAGNGRIISSRPVRTDVLVDAGVAYAAFGLFPNEGVALCAIDIETGSPVWCRRDLDISPQGYLLASPSHICVPCGRASPAIFDRSSGRLLGELKAQGGSFALVSGETILSGPGLKGGNDVGISDSATREAIFTFAGLRAVVTGNMAYVQSADDLSALEYPQLIALARERRPFLEEREQVDSQREKALAASRREEAEALQTALEALDERIAALDERIAGCTRWRKPWPLTDALVLAGEHLITGGAGEVAAVRAAGGEVVWRAAVPGRAGSLCVSAGRLVVGTDRGAIVCFGAPAEPRVEISGPSAGGSASPSAPAAAPSAEARGHDAAHPGSGGNPADAGGDGGGGSDGDGGGAAAPTTGGRDAPAPAGGESDDAAARAGELLEACGSRKGYCLIVDAKDASLAVALARRSELSIVCFERDPAIAAAIRADVVRSGLYGSRIAVLRADRPRFSFSGYLFRLVVLPDARSLAAWGPSLLDLPRTVRPEGGVLCAAAGEEETQDPLRRLLERLAAAGREDAQAPFTADRAGPWIVLRRGKVPGAGEWTQLYADAGHTASSGDALRAPLALQWFGRPGPRPMIDRHHRPTSPLCRDGRLFIPADEQIIAVDQYCGTELWRRGIPGSRRVGAMKHSGHLLLDGRSLLVASGSGCVSLDVESGEIRRTLQPPSLQEGLEWGYLGAVGNRLIATGREAGAAFRELRRETCDLLEGDLRPMVASRLLMALDREDGREVWTYHGAILDAAIAASGDRICFLESRDPSMAAAGGGRVRIDELFRGGARLVALAAEDGAALWKREIAPPFQHIAYLSATEDVVLLSGSFNDGDEVFYELMAFEAAGGGEIWRTRFRALDIQGRNPAEPDGTHGEQWQHPVIIAGTVYARPYAFDLQSGEKKDYLLQRGGHGCGGLTGSLHYLFGRGDHPRLYPTDVQLTEGLPITRVSRPGCWLNIIPAGGMVLIPEASSGCTCAYPIQTSFGFVPLSVGSAAGKPPENPAGSF